MIDKGESEEKIVLIVFIFSEKFRFLSFLIMQFLFSFDNTKGFNNTNNFVTSMSKKP
jgi:heme/copper-type cytochrome/quinol oxidase subunit 3